MAGNFKKSARAFGEKLQEKARMAKRMVTAKLKQMIAKEILKRIIIYLAANPLVAVTVFLVIILAVSILSAGGAFASTKQAAISMSGIKSSEEINDDQDLTMKQAERFIDALPELLKYRQIKKEKINTEIDKKKQDLPAAQNKNEIEQAIRELKDEDTNIENEFTDVKDAYKTESGVIVLYDEMMRYLKLERQTYAWSFPDWKTDTDEKDLVNMLQYRKDDMTATLDAKYKQAYPGKYEPEKILSYKTNEDGTKSQDVAKYEDTVNKFKVYKDNVDVEYSGMSVDDDKRGKGFSPDTIAGRTDAVKLGGASIANYKRESSVKYISDFQKFEYKYRLPWQTIKGLVSLVQAKSASKTFTTDKVRELILTVLKGATPYFKYLYPPNEKSPMNIQDSSFKEKEFFTGKSGIDKDKYTPFLPPLKDDGTYTLENARYPNGYLNLDETKTKDAEEKLKDLNTFVLDYKKVYDELYNYEVTIDTERATQPNATKENNDKIKAAYTSYTDELGKYQKQYKEFEEGMLPAMIAAYEPKNHKVENVLEKVKDAYADYTTPLNDNQQDYLWDSWTEHHTVTRYKKYVKTVSVGEQNSDITDEDPVANSVNLKMKVDFDYPSVKPQMIKSMFKSADYTYAKQVKQTTPLCGDLQEKRDIQSNKDEDGNIVSYTVTAEYTQIWTYDKSQYIDITATYTNEKGKKTTEKVNAGGSTNNTNANGISSDSPYPLPTNLTLDWKDGNASAYYPSKSDDPNNAREGGELTKLGTPVKPHFTIAVDPSCIPLGRYVAIRCSSNPEIDGTYIAEDIGGAIQGEGRIDIAMHDNEECEEFGVHPIQYCVLPEGFDINSLMPQIKGTTQERTDFIKAVEKSSIGTYKKYGVLPSITVAQGILESGSGKYTIGTANNLFGIKADSGWTGPTQGAWTKEQRADGSWYSVYAYFRKYASWDESIEDHGKFLYDNPRYKENGLFSATNYVEQAAALQKAGYATDHGYADFLATIIREEGLEALDNAAK